MIIWNRIQPNLRIIKLVKKIEESPGFANFDDEKELHRILKQQGLLYAWNDDIYNPEIIIFKATKQNVQKISALTGADAERELVALGKEEGWKADVWGVK